MCIYTLNLGGYDRYQTAVNYYAYITLKLTYDIILQERASKEQNGLVKLL